MEVVILLVAVYIAMELQQAKENRRNPPD